jgi:hypothetical protein
MREEDEVSYLLRIFSAADLLYLSEWPVRAHHLSKATASGGCHHSLDSRAQSTARPDGTGDVSPTRGA